MRMKKRRLRKSTVKSGARKLTPRRAKAHARAARDIAATLHDELIPPREETPDEPFMRM